MMAAMLVHRRGAIWHDSYPTNPYENKQCPNHVRFRYVVQVKQLHESTVVELTSSGPGNLRVPIGF